MWGWRLRFKAMTKHWEPVHCAVIHLAFWGGQGVLGFVGTVW